MAEDVISQSCVHGSFINRNKGEKWTNLRKVRVGFFSEIAPEALKISYFFPEVKTNNLSRGSCVGVHDVVEER